MGRQWVGRAAMTALAVLSVVCAALVGATGELVAGEASGANGVASAKESPDAAHSRAGVVDEEMKDRALAEPLVENVGELRRLHPKDPVWIDHKRKKVVMVGAVCGRETPLELFACLTNTKEYESVVAVHAQASVVHTALLAIGADPGHPVQFGETYRPATGSEIAVTVVWKDREGKRQSAPAQEWIRESRSRKAMKNSWVFAGSQLTRRENGRQMYAADMSGDLISVSNFSDAMLDVPIRSSDNDASLLFEAFTEHIPARGTPVTLILEVKRADKASEKKEPPK